MSHFEQTEKPEGCPALRLAQEVDPHGKERGGGKIIKLPSKEGLNPPCQAIVSSIPEAGGILPAQVLAREPGQPNVQGHGLAHDTVQVGVSCALWQDAELMARYEATVFLRPVGTPEEAAGEALFLASSAADGVTGRVLVVEG